jgi:two-component system NtrC family sensor kinase
VNSQTFQTGPVGANVEPVVGKRILVVEDEPLIAALLTDMLMADGHEVDAVGTGMAALERLARQQYDLIVSDLRMPELDGRGLYRELESRHPEMLPRMIFVTGSALDPGNEEFLGRTRAPWLSKPYSIADLHKFTQRALRRLAGED